MTVEVHGREGIGLVCEHITVAVDCGERVGFFWSDYRYRAAVPEKLERPIYRLRLEFNAALHLTP
jgi:hypothetical protein